MVDQKALFITTKQKTIIHYMGMKAMNFKVIQRFSVWQLYEGIYILQNAEERILVFHSIPSLNYSQQQLATTNAKCACASWKDFNVFKAIHYQNFCQILLIKKLSICLICWSFINESLLTIPLFPLCTA